MQRASVVFVLLALLVGCAIGAFVPDWYDTPRERCEEDQACWDCLVMGNSICGPTTTEEGA